MDLGLPESREPTLLMEEITAAHSNFKLGGMTRVEYLLEVERLILSRDTIGSIRGGRKVRVDSAVVAEELRSHQFNVHPRGNQTQPGLSIRELAGAMDAQDRKRTAPQEANDGS